MSWIVQNYFFCRCLKTNRQVVLMLLFITIAASFSSAFTLDRVLIQDRLQADSSLVESIAISLKDNELANYRLTLPPGAILVKLNGQDTMLVNQSLDIPLTCRYCNFTVTYKLPDATKRESEYELSYTRSLSLPQSPAFFYYEVYLPVGYILGSQSPDEQSLTVPRASEIDTDGRSIIVKWEEKLPQLPKMYYFRFHKSTERMSFLSEIQYELSEPPVWFFIIIMFFVGIGIGLYLSFRFRKKPMPTVLPSLFSPDEKEIIRIITANGKVISQKEIVRQTSWSKSKVSAVIANLLYKEIIRKEKQGRNYKVYLLKEISA